MPQFKPTGTISVSPPGGTGHHGHHPHHPHPVPGIPTVCPVSPLLHSGIGSAMLYGAYDQPAIDYHFATATHVGFTALWVVFGMFTVGFLVSMLLALRVEKKARLFHW